MIFLFAGGMETETDVQTLNALQHKMEGPFKRIIDRQSKSTDYLRYTPRTCDGRNPGKATAVERLHLDALKDSHALRSRLMDFFGANPTAG